MRGISNFSMLLPNKICDGDKLWHILPECMWKKKLIRTREASSVTIQKWTVVSSFSNNSQSWFLDISFSGFSVCFFVLILTAKGFYDLSPSFILFFIEQFTMKFLQWMDELWDGISLCEKSQASIIYLFRILYWYELEIHILYPQTNKSCHYISANAR